MIDVARFEDRLAVVECFEFGKFIDMLLDQIGELPEQAAALTGRKLAPCAVAIFKREACCKYRAIDVRRRRLGDLR